MCWGDLRAGMQSLKRILVRLRRMPYRGFPYAKGPHPERAVAAVSQIISSVNRVARAPYCPSIAVVEPSCACGRRVLGIWKCAITIPLLLVCSVYDRERRQQLLEAYRKVWGEREIFFFAFFVTSREPRACIIPTEGITPLACTHTHTYSAHLFSFRENL